MKILIIEDDYFIRELLKIELEKWGFDIVIVQDFTNTIEIFEIENPSLIIMDIKLPVFDGYYFTKLIREKSDVPILFISSVSENMNQIMAMEMGADDFIVKPFEVNIVVSKIKALLRRAYTYSGSENMSNSKIKYNSLKLEIAYEDKTVELTKTENTIMNLFFAKKNRFIARNELIEACWQGDDYIDENTLYVNISRLRKKMEYLGLKDVIETKKNIGYRLNDENI